MFRRIFFFLISYIPVPFYGWIQKLYNVIILKKNPESVCHFGELDSNVTYYIVDDECMGGGLASYYDALLGYAIRAERKKWIPLYYTRNREIQEENGQKPILEDFFANTREPQEILEKGANVVLANRHLITSHRRIDRKERHRRYEASKKFEMLPNVREYCRIQYKQIFNTGGQRICWSLLPRNGL